MPVPANGSQMHTNYQIDGNTNTQKDRAGLRMLPISEVVVREVKVITSGFAPEFDPRSAMELVLPDPASGPAGGPAARIGFRLGVPDAQQPHTWCALVDRSPRDLSGAQGLVLWLKADAAYRMWVELRDANPASADEGTEWWFGSVRSSTEWRRVSVPFAALRSLNPASDGRLDLDAVRGVVFKLDRGSVKPGTSGTIWLAELGVY